MNKKFVVPVLGFMAVSAPVQVAAAPSVSSQLAAVAFAAGPVKSLKPFDMKMDIGATYAYDMPKIGSDVSVTILKGVPNGWFLSITSPKVTIREVLGVPSYKLLKQAPMAAYYRVDGGPFKGAYASKSPGLINLYSRNFLKAQKLHLFDRQ